MQQRHPIAALVLTLALAHLFVMGSLVKAQTQIPRDTFARAETDSARAAIDGRIVAANSGRPLKRAQVVATARDFRGRFSPRPMRLGGMFSRTFHRGATP